MFKRGLSQAFVEALEKLATEANWWSEVLADENLIIAVRDEYLNVYWQGQALFHISLSAGSVRAKTHVKYLLDPSLSHLIPLDGSTFELPQGDVLTRNWEAGKTLQKLRRTAERYAGGEKQAVHRIVRANPNVVDVEIAFGSQSQEDEDEWEIPRVDMLCLKQEADRVRLAFWEVKLFVNPEIRATPPKPPYVLAQIAQYRDTLEAEREDVLKSYRTVARNLLAISSMRPGKPAPGALIRSVANEPECLVLGSPPEVGLVVTGFDKDQRDGSTWSKHREVLVKALGKDLTKFKGSPDGLVV